MFEFLLTINESYIKLIITSIKHNLSFNKFVLEEEIIYKYTDEEFMNKVNDKIGNVRLFKKHLRKQGLIGNRQQFSSEHIQLFEDIRKYKKNHHTTWEIAFRVGLDSFPKNNGVPVLLINEVSDSPQNNIESILTEILKTLQRIEEKL
ncbi:hypothetical protein ABKQ09_19970 [Bacillus atrophaeus]|uniref:hypothetical protein n=1 Tax=Bacillus atrophaeus TaxID=1452 RepID=UPI00227FF941|nr:hypothetical protein [Bacillus atrophaeus]